MSITLLSRFYKWLSTIVLVSFENDPGHHGSPIAEYTYADDGIYFGVCFP
jgi:hypothetical protein